MAYRITFVLSSFPSVTDEEKLAAHRCIEACLQALMAVDVAYLLAHPEAPMLYESGVYYEEEPPGQEDWCDVGDCLKNLELGRGSDCEDLACWRAAELRVRSKVMAKPTFLWRSRPNGGMLYHIQVQYPDGRVEDPSRRLGMK